MRLHPWPDDLNRSGVADAKNTKASQLVDRLREAILSGELKPGFKINLDTTRKVLDVSLSPLREALARLIAVGLVELHDNRGYSVAPVSLQNLAEITRLRVETETLALSIAIKSAEGAWESAVIRALHKLNRIVRDPLDHRTIEAWESAHQDYHSTLIGGCRMPLLLNFCVTLHNLNDRYRRTFLVDNGGDHNVGFEHSDIAQAAVARDHDYACEKMRQHIQRTGANLLQRLTRDGALTS